MNTYNKTQKQTMKHSLSIYIHCEHLQYSYKAQQLQDILSNNNSLTR